MDIRFDTLLYSNLGNENSIAGHIKWSRDTRAASDPWAAGFPPLHYTVDWSNAGSLFVFDPNPYFIVTELGRSMVDDCGQTCGCGELWGFV